jgi:hypothetical protein
MKRKQKSLHGSFNIFNIKNPTIYLCGRKNAIGRIKKDLKCSLCTGQKCRKRLFFIHRPILNLLVLNPLFKICTLSENSSVSPKFHLQLVFTS